MRSTRHIWLITLWIVLLSSCVHREFDYESSHNARLDVVFDWSNEPQANPESMTLYMFPADGSRPTVYEFNGREGGTIRIEPGIYHAICINSDTRDVYYRNAHSHAAFEITTTESTTLNCSPATEWNRPLNIPRAPGTESQQLMIQPPLLWSQSVSSFEVLVAPPTRRNSTHSGNDSPNQVLRIAPERIVDTYMVTVRKINNIEALSAMSATISDMSDGYLAGLRTPNDIPSTITMELSHNKTDATANGVFLTFGHCPADIRNHKLLILALLKDGRQCYFEFDVSRQAHAEPDADNIHHIVVDMINLPEPQGPSGGGGFTPAVDDWQSIDVGIEM